MSFEVLCGDNRQVLATLENQSVQCVVTSPPYFGLRDYGVDGQIGLEPTPAEFVEQLVGVFREVRRVLADDGVLWLNLGDSYAANQSNNGGYSAKSTLAGFSRADTKGRQMNDAGERRRIDHGAKPKDLLGIPWRVAFALQADGWYLRSDIIWAKPNPMPESVTDRPTKAHEYVFLLTKNARYYYDADAVRENHQTADRKGARRSYAPGSASSYRLDEGHETQHGAFAGLPLNARGRNKRDVWWISPQPFKGAHFATMPEALVEPCILAGSRPGDLVLDPFSGSGRVGLVALTHGRDYLGIDLNPDYCLLAIDALTERAAKVAA